MLPAAPPLTRRNDITELPDFTAADLQGSPILADLSKTEGRMDALGDQSIGRHRFIAAVAGRCTKSERVRLDACYAIV
jgi:hypothetical protein